MPRFVLVLFGVTAALHVPFAFAAARALGLAGLPGAPFVAAGAAIGLVAALGGRMRLLADDRPVTAARMLLVEEPFFIHWGATVLAAPLLLLAVPIALASGRSFGDGALGAYVTAVVVSAWSVVVRRRWVRVRTIDVPIRGLGAAFEGYRIAHLSDLHIGAYCPKSRAERWVASVNALEVDLVACTGDYVTSGTRFHEDIAAILGGLRGKDGTIATMGNHDYFGDGEPLISLLRERGVLVLRNEHRALERGDDRLTIAGVDDVWTRRADVERALAGRDPGLPLVVLAHDPKLFPEIARRGAALVLSGHTHWGQVALPFAATRMNLSSVAFHHHADVYRDGDAVLYVHPGLGTTGPPLRLGVAPEITILRLGRAPDGVTS